MTGRYQDGLAKDECEGCELGRREFLRRAALSALGITAALAGSTTPAAAGPFRLIAAGGGSTGEKAYPIPSQDGVSIDTDSEVILVRHAGHVYAFALSCPHQNTALRWHAEDSRFECPKHHSKYEADGTFITGRATRAMDRLPIRRAGQQVVVDVDTAFRQDTQAAEWAAAVVAL
jgi:nitrite reductase/ring-hydroxylating ferredoxin subunit